ncbi:MAG: M48 family metallopeptidase [Clostridiaceae bacterium]|nr:M48 family metallopeptidase [Clostridiaceae bacterium]
MKKGGSQSIRVSPSFGLRYVWIRSSRRTTAIKLNESGDIVLLSSKYLSGEYADYVVDHRYDWICKRRQARKDRIIIPRCSDSDKKILSDHVRLRFFFILSTYTGKKPSRVFIRFGKTSWGSCSSLGNISLNGYLYYLPDDLFNYVVFHELTHLYHMNHSPDFWLQLGKCIPDAKLARKRLLQFSLPG